MNSLAQIVPRFARPSLTKLQPRKFTTLTPLRPTFSPSSRLPFRPSLPSLTAFTPSSTPAPSTAGENSEAPADVLSRSSITTHPSFLGVSQIRCGPRKQKMNGHSRLIQKRRNGFLNRLRCRNGRNTLSRRRVKGRKDLAH